MKGAKEWHPKPWLEMSAMVLPNLRYRRLRPGTLAVLRCATVASGRWIHLIMTDQEQTRNNV